MKDVLLATTMALQIPGSCVQAAPPGYEAGPLEVPEALSLSFHLTLARRFTEARCLAQAVADMHGSATFDDTVEAHYRLLEISFITGDMDLAETSGRRLLSDLRGKPEYATRRARLFERLCNDEDWASGRVRFSDTCATERGTEDNLPNNSLKRTNQSLRD
jgi:hypothetical protein